MNYKNYMNYEEKMNHGIEILFNKCLNINKEERQGSSCRTGVTGWILEYIYKYLNIKKEHESILLIYTPEDNYEDTIKYAEKGKNKFFWREHSEVFSESKHDNEWYDQIYILKRDRREISKSILNICQKEGYPLIFFPLSISKEKGLENKIIKDIKSNAKISNIILDFSLLGIENYTKPKLNIFKSTIRDIIMTKRMRGIDIHNLTADSLIDGAMQEDYLSPKIHNIYEKIADPETNIVKIKKLIIKSEDKLVYLELSVEEKTKVIMATGILEETGILKPQDQWHYLPSGGISICINHKSVNGSVTLNGPVWGVENLQYDPVELKIVDGEIKIVDEEIDPSANYIAIKKLIEEKNGLGKYIGELFLGFNTKANRDSESPYEFYVANNTVTLGLGRNSHLGGKNPKSKFLLIPNVHSHARINSTSIIADKEIILMEKGEWI